MDFVRRGEAEGEVKGRIIRLYDKLADEVVDAAKGPSVNLLTKEFKKVEEEISVL